MKELRENRSVCVCVFLFQLCADLIGKPDWNWIYLQCDFRVINTFRMVIEILTSASASAAKAVGPAVASAASSVVGSAIKSVAGAAAKAVVTGAATKVS